jgi:hypothetical protein
MLAWVAFGAEWALAEKVSINGYTKRITVNAGVTSLDIRSDVYSAWVRWYLKVDNSRWLPAMRYSGADPIPGGETGVTFFLINGWKLEYDPNLVAVSGVLYSDDYATAFWSAADQPLFPATVSSLVNSAVTTQNVVTGDLSAVPASVWGHSTRTLTASNDPTKEQIAAQVRTELAAELLRILELAKLHGLVAGSPLVVSPTARSSSGITQTINTVGDTTTVSRT